MKDDVFHPPSETAEDAPGAPDDAPAPRPKPRHFFIAWILGAAIVGLVGYAGYWALRPKEQPSRRSGRGAFGGTQPVGVATVAKGDIKIMTGCLLGAVVPIANVVIKTQLNGYLKEVAFKEGQLINKGDFLAQIDPRPYEVQKAQFEGQLLHDQGLLNQARDDLRRYQALRKQDSIARQQAENQIWIVKQYEGSVKSDQAQVDNQKLNLTYAHIISPVAGRVGLRQVDAGSYVTTQDANGIVLVTQIDPISVIFTVAEDLAPDVLSAMKSTAPLETAAWDRECKKQLAVGHLQTLDNTIDPSTGMVKARAEFENKDNRLYPNQFVSIKLLLGVDRNVLTMPKTAIKQGGAGLLYVWVVDEDDKVATRSVTTFDPGHGDLVEVKQGLNEGDRVVVDGSDRLRNGAKVRIDQPGSNAAGSDKPATEGARSEKGQWDPEKRREHGSRRQPEAQ